MRELVQDFYAQRLRDDFVGIETQDPIGVPRYMIDTPVHLGGVVEPTVFQYVGTHFPGDLDGSVRRAAIHHQNVIRDETRSVQAPGDMALFILGQDDGGEGHGGSPFAAGDGDHRLGEGRHPPDAFEARRLEPGFKQKRGKRRDRPELDVPVIPERGEMGVHRSRHRERQVLQISVVGRRDDRRPTRLDQIEQGPRIIARGVDMLDHLEADHDRNRPYFSARSS